MKNKDIKNLLQLKVALIKKSFPPIITDELVNNILCENKYQTINAITDEYTLGCDELAQAFIDMEEKFPDSECIFRLPILNRLPESFRCKIDTNEVYKYSLS